MVKGFLPVCFISRKPWELTHREEITPKAYGDNSKGYGDRIHPYKKA